MLKAIKFLHPWRGREPGQIDRQLDYGVMDTLVLRRLAQWHDDEDKGDKGPEQTSAPVPPQRHKAKK